MINNKGFKNSKLIKKIKDNKSVNIVCFGNSITWGHVLSSYIDKKPTNDSYPFNLEKLLRKYYSNNKINVINEGHDGWTTKDAFNHNQGLKKVLAINPDLVIVMFGIIEVIMLPNLSLEEYIKYLDKIVNTIKKYGSEVVLLSPTPILFPDFILKKYSKATIEYAIKKNLSFIDMRKEVFDYMKSNNLNKWDILKIDNAHFREDKYKIISEIIFKNIFKTKKR